MDAEYFTIEGNRISMDGGGMFGSAPKALWQKWFTSDDNNQVRFATRCLVFKNDKLTVLMEAGAGAFMKPELADRYKLDISENTLINNLYQKNITEEAVDYVILSHLHFDHTGGIVPKWPATQQDDWTPLFPNAKYIVSRAQFERSANPHPRDRASYINGLSQKLEASGRLILVDEKNTSIPELDGIISLEITNGHTPGLLHTLLHVDGRKIYYASDLIPGTAWVHLPITAGFDRNPELVVDEKIKILDRAIKENWIIVYTHDPNTPWSQVRLDDSTGRFQPASVA